MTVEQDVRNLQALNADLERRLQEITDLVYLWKVNGAQDLFAEAGGQIYGGGKFRLDSKGIQMIGEDYAAHLSWVPSEAGLVPDPTKTWPRSFIFGYANETEDKTYVGVGATKNDQGTAQIQCYAEDDGSTTDEQYVNIYALHPGGNAASLQVLQSATRSEIKISHAPLYLYAYTADPTTTLEDGMLWYRSDTDEIRARINGSTVSLSTGGGAMKVQGDGYYTLPTTIGTGTAVTAGSGSYGSWAEIEDSTAEAIYITHVTFEDAGGSSTYFRLQIGTGAAASETTVSEVSVGAVSTNPTGGYTITLPYPIAVATSTRIALRAAGSAAVSTTVNLTVVAQADVVAM